MPMHTALCAITATLCGIFAGLALPARLQNPAFLMVFLFLLVLLKILKKEDYLWMRGLIKH